MLLRQAPGYRPLLLGCVLVLGLLVGCDRGESAAGADGQTVIGFSQCTVSEPWRVEFNRRLREHAATMPDVKLEILDANDQTAQQVSQVRSFINRGVDAILISPKESAGLSRVVEEAVAAGIPTIVLDRDLTYQGYDAFVGGDNLAIGRAAGEWVVEQLGGKGSAEGVVYEICGNLASTPAQERRGGFHEIVEQEPGIEIIGGLDADWKKQQAFNVFQDALKTLPEIDVVYAHNDPMAHGAYQAARAAGRADEMMFVGIDALPNEGIQWVKDGELTATFSYPTPGEKGLDLALALLAGTDVDKRVMLPTVLWTQETIAAGGREIPARPVEQAAEPPTAAAGD